MENKQRLQSLDVLRGLTVAGMILVNNGYGESFEMLRHSKWNGMTPCDLVFPFFLFIMGISCYLSLSKSNFTPTKAVVCKVLKRTVLLFVIGLFINWFELLMEGKPLDFAHLRIWAVMQRIALCYGLVSLFALFCSHRYTLHTIIALLALYTFLLLWGNGYSEDAATNLLAQTDLRLFGYDHLYHKSPVDPEGLLGTISATAHVLIGFYCGLLIKRHKELPKKVIALFAVGTVCVIAGYLMTYGLPLNKRIWSPSYVLVTCGLASLLQALFMQIVDGKSSSPSPSPRQNVRRQQTLHSSRFTLHFSPFTVFGVNALALYVGSELLAILFGHFGISAFIYDALHVVIPPLKWASLAYALVFVFINYLLGYWLYRRKIFIKL